LLKHAERNPLITTTFGTGELIRCALDRGCREIILGIGGSATIDGGVGMAQALGIIFTDTAGNETGMGGASLGNIYHIDLSQLDTRLKACKIYVACDVTNPLTGSEGAAYVFGPQKGAKPAAVKKLNDNLIHLSRVIFDQLQVDLASLPGAGAAGGLGAGIVAFLNGMLMPGFDLISKTVQLEKWIDWADLVITGEGKMDVQTAYGKTPAGVANLALRKGKPLLAFTGETVDNPDEFHQMGFNAVIPIANGPMTLEKSIKEAGRLLENAGERMARVLKLGKALL
jgi:glycerate kinase